MAKRTPGPQIGHNQQWTPFSTHGLWKPPGATRSDQERLSLTSGKIFPSFMDPIPKDPGMAHIWYNIPSCTIIAQQSNGDVFRTQICNFNSSPRIHHPIQNKTFQSFSLSIPDGYQKTICGPQPPGPAGVGLLFHFRIIQGVISRGHQSFNQFLRNQALQYSFDYSIGPYRLYFSNLYGLGPFGPIHIPLWELCHIVQFARWPDLY
ncbi:hypothetical protein O181_121089 [Austropuccinia psidii MF-1]|uniref:Uncharacterized protein n=1 Tax=Austropuccinia psidii MF-1 TaxID=1389203 RepID=A0A9Q3Q111_9BASI|nr:hypothetical protein [Austropuccinia psidii MF-1]